MYLLLLYFIYFSLLKVLKVKSRFLHVVFLHVSAGLLINTRKYNPTNEIIFSPKCFKDFEKDKNQDALTQ